MIKAEEIQIIYEISMDIGVSLDLNQMLRTAIVTYLRKLNCIIGAIFKKEIHKNDISFKKIFSIPKNPQNNGFYKIALKEIPFQLKKKGESAFYSKLPIIKKENSNIWYYIMDLPGFGLMLLIKNGEFLKSEIIKSLKPLNLKLAYNCNACQAQEELSDSKDKYLNAYNRADFFLDIFTHDMRNILQIIRSATDLGNLLVEINQAELSEYLKLIQSQVERGNSLISNVQMFANIEEKEIIKDKIDLIHFLNQILYNVKLRFKEKKIKIVLNHSEQSLEVYGGEFLYNAIENLLINAIIHNESEIAIINIKLTPILNDKKNLIKVEILDNGKGIIDELKEKIFDRAYKSDKNIGGMGIGLSLVKKIINLYGGQVWVENRVKNDYTKGSNFIITLQMN